MLIFFIISKCNKKCHEDGIIHGDLTPNCILLIKAKIGEMD